MKVKMGDGRTSAGPGVVVELSGSELAEAVDLYLLARRVVVRGPRTVRYRGELLAKGLRVHVDPSGFVIRKGKKTEGRGPC